jgi:predicted nucleotidyltransferase/DNA-binding XRE family transcriptional regulator
MTSPIDIGPLLAATRIAQGLSQRRLAEMVGVKQPQVARWEAGSYRSATLARVDAVARALDVTLEAPAQFAAESPAAYAILSATPSDTGTRALARLGVSAETIAAFCRLHGVREMALFGSSVRTDFTLGSDVDVLVSWREGAEPRSLVELADLETELAGIFRRRVDLVDRAVVERSENHLRRSRILDGARSVYVA